MTTHNACAHEEEAVRCTKRGSRTHQQLRRCSATKHVLLVFTKLVVLCASDKVNTNNPSSAVPQPPQCAMRACEWVAITHRTQRRHSRCRLCLILFQLLFVLNHNDPVPNHKNRPDYHWVPTTLRVLVLSTDETPATSPATREHALFPIH